METKKKKKPFNLIAKKERKFNQTFIIINTEEDYEKKN